MDSIRSLVLSLFTDDDAADALETAEFPVEDETPESAPVALEAPPPPPLPPIMEGENPRMLFWEKGLFCFFFRSDESKDSSPSDAWVTRIRQPEKLQRLRI